MDLNLVVLCGRVAVAPELIEDNSHSRLLRILLTVRAEYPRTRIDVVPVRMWDPPDDLIEPGLTVAERVLVTGAVQRRFSDGAAGRRSRIEVVAFDVARHHDLVSSAATRQ